MFDTNEDHFDKLIRECGADLPPDRTPELTDEEREALSADISKLDSVYI